MAKSKKNGEQKISAKVVVLGVIIFVLLAGICFNFGYYYMKSRLKVTPQPEPETAQAPQPVLEGHPAPPQPETPPVDISITETGEQEQAPKNEDEITVTLEPGNTETPAPKPEAEKPKPAPKPAVAEEPKPVIPTETKPAEVKPQPDSAVYRIQVGTFSDKANADKLADSIIKKGHSVEIKPVQADGKTLYRVTLNKAYKTREEAQKTADSLADGTTKPLVLTEKTAP